MNTSSIYFTNRLFTRLRRAWPPSIGLCLALLVSATVWAQTAPASSAGSESEAARAYRLGIDLVKAGHVDKAISTFESGLKSDPQSTVLLNVIGATYTLKGNFEQAEDYLLRCLQTDPGFVPARKNLAISYFDSGKYDLAVPEFEKLINTTGESRSVAFLFLGIIAEKQGNFSKSASLLGESGGVVDQYPQALLSLAHSLLELNQAQKADAVLRSLDAMSGVTRLRVLQSRAPLLETGSIRTSTDRTGQGREGRSRSIGACVPAGGRSRPTGPLPGGAASTQRSHPHQAGCRLFESSGRPRQEK